jgi:hypothetical protein
MQAPPHTASQLFGPAVSSHGTGEAGLHETPDSSPASNPNPSLATIVAGEKTAVLHGGGFVPQPVGISIYE